MDPPEAPCEIVESLTSIRSLVEAIEQASVPWLREGLFSPLLYINLEGSNLSRHGSVFVMAIYVEPLKRVYLVDVHKLKAAAFEAQAPSGASLRSIFEGYKITKCFFDVRDSSNALYFLFGVKPQGVEEIQLLENAARPAGERLHLAGLARCITNDATLSSTQKQDWERTRDLGLGLFHPSRGRNVQYLPQLWDMYWIKLNGTWRNRVKAQTSKRLTLSQSEDYDPQAEGKNMGPWPEEDKKEALLRQEHAKRSKTALDEYFENVMCD